MANKASDKPWPFWVYLLFAVVICTIGLFDAVYLSVAHYRVYTDMDYHSFCAVSKAINCDTVSQSPYSVFLNVPVPVWGVFGYVLVGLLLFNAWRCRKQPKKPMWGLIFVVAFVYSGNSLVLAGISSFVIRSHCIMCILSHAVNFGLLFLSWLIHKRFEQKTILSGFKHDIHLLRKSGKGVRVGLATLFVGALALTLFFPAYWNMQHEAPLVQLKNGITDEGYPWIGAENPELTIHEFSDYQCFQCKKMHTFLRNLISEHSDRIRLVHRHFPMDRAYNPLVREEFHTGSGKMAILALYAQQKEQFWEMNDLLFDLAAKKEDFNTRTIAEKMGTTSGEVVAALKSKALRIRLKHDIAVGLQKGIDGTPGFVINDKVYLGFLPADALRAYVN